MLRIVLISLGILLLMEGNAQNTIVLDSIYSRVYAKNLDMIKVKRDGKIGFINFKGEEVIPCTFKWINYFNHQTKLASFVDANKRVGFLNTQGETVIKPRFDEVWYWHSKLGIVQVREGSKYGFIDTLGNEIIPIIHLQAHSTPASFKHNAVLQRTAEGYGIFNGYGKQLHAYQFDYLYGDDDVFDQRFIRYKQGEIKGYLTWPEMTNHPVPYSYCGDFSNAMAVVKKDTLYGYIDTTFRVKIKTCYRRAEAFSEEFAAVQNDKKKWAFINKKGKKITPFKYDKVYPFSNGRAAVRIDSLVGFINFTGQEVIPLVYQLDFEHDWSFKRGYGFTDSLCFIRKNGKYGLIDIDGNTLLPFEYDNVSFVDAYRLKLRDWHSKNANYALMSKGKYIFAVNNKGELIPNSQSTRLTYFIEGKSYVCDNDSSCRFINSDGDIIFPKTYDYYEYSTFNNGFCVVKKNDKFGIIDQSGNVIIPVRYDKLNNFSNNICKGVIGNAVYFINQKAEHVLEIPLKQSAHSE